MTKNQLIGIYFIALVFVPTNILLSQTVESTMFPWCQQDTLVLISIDSSIHFSKTAQINYPKINDEPSSLTAFEQYGLYGFKDTNGQVVLSPMSEEVGIFREGFVWTKLDHKRYLYIDKKGNPLIEYTFDRCFDFQNGLAKVLDFNDSKGYQGYGFINTEGAIVVPLIYEEAFGFVGDYAMVKDQQGWWLIDQNGDKIIGPNINLLVQDDLFSCQHNR